jgi:NADP-dependent 3-hydroxy acid dehydrogenase YdfG
VLGGGSAGPALWAAVFVPRDRGGYADGMKALDGRIAVVTGASAGIGAAVARELAMAGAKVVINARRKHRLQSLAAEIEGECGAGRIHVVAGDCCDGEIIAAMLDAAKERFGEGKREADLVVVNAGRGLRGSVYDSDDAQWEEVIRINLLAAAKLMRAAAERMIGTPVVVQGAPKTAEVKLDPDWPRRARDIVVLGSTVGRHVSPFSSMYGSAKAGVHMLNESLRRVCGPRGVRVSLLEPGIVRSEFQDVAGYDPASFGAFMDSISPVLTPEDIARTIGFIVGQPAGVHVNDVMIRPTRQEYP